VPLVVGGAVNPGDYELVCGGQTITDSVTIPQGDSSVNISLVQLNSQASGVVGICLQTDATHHILPGQDSVCGSLYGAMTSKPFDQFDARFAESDARCIHGHRPGLR